MMLIVVTGLLFIRYRIRRHRVMVAVTDPSTITIRPGALVDSTDLYQGLHALAKHQQLPISIGEEAFKQALFGPTRHLHSLVARTGSEDDSQGTLLGFALFSYRWGTFSGEWVLYLNDIFVAPEARGQKIGQRLMAQLQKLAAEHQCARMEWHCLTTNGTGKGFYDGIGAEMTGQQWLTYKW